MEVESTGSTDEERGENIRLITESAEGVLRDDLARSRKLRFENARFDKAKWMEFTELGWLAMLLAEERGGFGFGMLEFCALAQQLGKALVPEPILASALALNALPDEQIEKVVAGKDIILAAFAKYDGDVPVLKDGLLSGATEPLLADGTASYYVVQTSNGAALVAADANGLNRVLRPTHDGGCLTHLTFDNSPALHLDFDMHTARDHGALGAAAYLLGLAETAFEMTLNFIKDRQQFGKPIGSFQILQHRAVDQFLELSLLRASVNAAATTADSGVTEQEVRASISRAKARAIRATQLIVRDAIQLHGGIGYTDESDIGLYLRKCMTIANLFGTERFHRERAVTAMEQQ